LQDPTSKVAVDATQFIIIHQSSIRAKERAKTTIDAKQIEEQLSPALKHLMD
jgi:hypothetical protein